MRHSFLSILILTLAISSCGSSNPTSASNSGLSRFSGVWSGTVTNTQVGACTFTGGPRNVTMDWTVTDAGQVNINERQSSGTWSNGTITADLRVSINHTNTSTCFGSSNTHSVTYSGTIQTVGSSDRVDLEATETPCPPDCVFRIVYSMTKQ